MLRSGAAQGEMRRGSELLAWVNRCNEEVVPEETDDVESASTEDGSTSDGSDGDEATTSSAEVLALCISGTDLGCAHYRSAECRVEVFAVPICVAGGEAVRGGNTSKHSRRGSPPIRIVTHEDIPPALLWLWRYLEIHRPRVLLPHIGAETLSDLINLVAAEVGPIDVVLLNANTAFKSEEALQRLACMYPNQQDELPLRFHTEQRTMMAAMAALLHFTAAVQANIADVVERGPQPTLYISSACLEALQITRMEPHPSSGQGRGRAKEGFALRSLVDATQSAVGRAMMRQWFALPSSDAAEIEARQEVVAFFLRPEYQDTVAHLRAALHIIRPTNHLFTMIRCGKACLKHYKSLQHTLRGMLLVHDLLTSVAHRVTTLYAMLQRFPKEPLEVMANTLARTVAQLAKRRCRGLPHKSTATASICLGTAGGGGLTIADGVDEILDELRARFHDLHLSLQAKAEAAFEALPDPLRRRLTLRCLYVFPHGYLLSIPSSELLEVLAETSDLPPAVVADESRMPTDFNFTDSTTELEDSASESLSTAVGQAHLYMEQQCGWWLHHEAGDGMHYYKSSAMVELDEWVGDVQSRIEQRELYVRREMDTSLLFSSLHLLRPARMLGELDCLLSFAWVSAKEGWTRPVLATHSCAKKDDTKCKQPPAPDGGVLNIHDGWHPLLNRYVAVQQRASFTLSFDSSTDRVGLILGVNGSGKSVLMSAIAHIVFLAHIGCNVPAAAAQVSVISAIFFPTASVRSVSGLKLSPSGSFHTECVALSRTLHYVHAQRALSDDGAVLCASLRSQSIQVESHMGASSPARSVLVLIDEFGRGTAPHDGAVRLNAVLRYFAEPYTPAPQTLRPLVLCSTHFVEMLSDLGYAASPLPTASTDSQPDSEPLATHPHFCSDSLSFPHELVKIYEMECLAVRQGQPEGDSSVPLLPLADHHTTDQHDSLSGSLIPTDVIPTFQPRCITPRPGHHCADWLQWRHTICIAGPALGRQCGINSALVKYWEDALHVMNGAV